MAGVGLWVLIGLCELYLLLALTVGALTWQKGYKLLGILGVLLPLLWLVGVCLPTRRGSYYETYRDAQRNPTPRAGKAVGVRRQGGKWDDTPPSSTNLRQGPIPTRPDPTALTLAENSAPAANPLKESPGLSRTTPPVGDIGDTRAQRSLEFLRWLVESGLLTP